MNDYPAFSADEMRRRRDAFEAMMEQSGVDRVLVYGADRSGSAVQWLTGWPVTREAAVVVGRGEQDALFVQFYNHLPLARQLARAADVRAGGASTITAAVEELCRRGGEQQRVGVVGPLSFTAAAVLSARAAEVVSMGGQYTRLRLVKSEEELDWMRTGARLSDAGMRALAAGLRSGLTEHELADIVERAYVPRGGTTQIHYFGVTSMQTPSRCVPAQFTSSREVGPGDAVTLELSAQYWGYAGQVLRTFAVEAEPSALYQELHDVADAAFDAIVATLRDGATPDDVVAAAGVIEDAGFTIWDDLVHGYGGGYLPPVVGSRSRPATPPATQPFATGMTVVVQPNIVTLDGTAGVQTGELVVVTPDGAESLHEVPRGLRRVG
ncbi:MAG: M24 family metallopeptidase [Nitriliruptorales bacterium]|nr:M24 family metallopeptidase [Nitriliruptorales bacterium]